MPDPTQNILAAWLAHLRAGGEVHTDSEALGRLNAALGSRYTLRRLYEWRAGARPTPAPVARYCAIDGGLRHVLDASGPRVRITPAQVEAVTDALT